MSFLLLSRISYDYFLMLLFILLSPLSDNLEETGLVTPLYSQLSPWTEGQFTPFILFF